MTIVNQKPLFSATALLLAATFLAPASAAEAGGAFGDFKPEAYLQGSVGQAYGSSPARTGTAMDLNGSAHGLALRAAAGARFGAYFGAELAYFRLSRMDVDANPGTAGYTASVYALSVTGTVPLGPVFVEGRLGGGRSSSKVAVGATGYQSNSRRDTFVWGAGLRYPVARSLDATLDYDNLGAIGRFAQGDKFRASVVSIGLRFKF